MPGVEEHRVDPHREPALAALGGADQLQSETHLARGAQVVGLQMLDALVAHVLDAHGGTERQAREDRHLRCRVAAAHIVARVGLGVAAALRLGERLRVGAAAGHLAEDVVGRAVDDPVDALDRGRGERLLQQSHHGHRAGHRGLEAQPHVLARGRPRTAPRRVGRAAACLRSPRPCRRASPPAGTRAPVRPRRSTRPRGPRRRAPPRRSRACASARP